MERGNYQGIQDKVVNRFTTLNAEVGDESKIIFTFYTSAPKGSIKQDKLRNLFYEALNDRNKFELRMYYSDDICAEIKEAESLRPTVEAGQISIDAKDNFLEYGDDAVIVNASAFSIKELYAMHQLNLLSRNLRYHVSGNNIDKAINESIKNDPDDFWFKNNGLTIICDDFAVDSKVVKLKNFSIVNGGQTTYNINKSNYVDRYNDFYLPCKIIKTRGKTEDEKNKFSLDIATATNSQKAIKAIDLKANSPEQVRFSKAMRMVGIYYQTKRGELVPKEFKEDYLNSDLADVGKLCLAGIFQLPATSRNKPSTLYSDQYYGPIFNGDQGKVANLVKELLYFDYYFKKRFVKHVEEKFANHPNKKEYIPFANNARTLCIAFTALAARYHSGNISLENIETISSNIGENSYNTIFYDIFRNIDGLDHFFPKGIFENKDVLDTLLDKLYLAIIKSGGKCYLFAKGADNTLSVSNYLKKDTNYYTMLKIEWDTLSEIIANTFSNL